MISVIIATDESEQVLVPTLAALVPGAMGGLLREVIIADAGSHDGTEAVADVAGCRFMSLPGPLGTRLTTAAAAVNAPWLLFLRPGSVPDVTWVNEANRFILDAERMRRPQPQAAVFRHAPASGNARSALAEAFGLIAAVLGARPRPDQGLLISKTHYDAIGGHRAERSDAETDLLRRLGRRQIALLRSSVTTPRD